ncbi:hydrogenase maturation protein HypF [Sporobacter termitidis DSM 10068]|uniref:Carbamoyltransferase n=1 Tax=Sporobacter termitidis DSM 10068 TaxID=1123282 RepID=A0A1M5Z0L0_9FIRM|nr:carbamoyltransferase HypF [Sporobacter termitidis]SHI17729.1 hydrogenase maturation protein HypF [Sporobacter termitidis DSM 10068]
MAHSQNGRITADIEIRGVVQGVGFRPFVARLANRHGLTGFVKNESGHVVIRALGPEKAVRRFLDELAEKPPAGARIDSIEKELSAPSQPEEGGFVIAGSGRSDFSRAMISPDIAVCEDCLREMTTPGDPRYLNPFISCVACGPRFTIIDALPYDRETTVMSDFDMCPLCRSQYHDPADRRCHAQTVCCNGCGPVLRYEGRGEAPVEADAVARAVAALKSGGIVAVKGIGGYHFACSPYDGGAVGKLRELKGREDKPFAVMFPAPEDILSCCRVSDAEKELLLSPARPIVLLNRARGDFAESVCGASRFLGAFLPYTPLQYLLLRETGPLVMTSANVSSLPIIKDDGEMRAFFKRNALLDGVLTHNRRILRRLDDSVATVVNGKIQLLRRARGYVPLPVEIAALQGCPPLLACGAQQKSAALMTAGPLCYPTTEMGDLDSVEAMDFYRETVRDMAALFHLKPAYAVCDMHPDYAAARYARETGLPVIEVQHHFAHIASVMAEHDIREPVIGVAFDGTGYGTDGTVWGGEFLIASPGGFKRAGHLKAVKLLGSDDSVKHNWKTAACYMADAGIGHAPCSEREKLVRAALGNNINTIRSSSMGRVFDAVSAMLGICGESTYEGQGAIELENAAAAYRLSPEEDAGPLPYGIRRGGGAFIADLAPCLRAIVAERDTGAETGLLALRFHLTIAGLIADMCTRLREEHGITKVCLSGGVFQNRVLLEKTGPLLASEGFEVFLNEKVPPNDGGIALGQAYAAGHRIMNSNGEGTAHVRGGIRQID